MMSRFFPQARVAVAKEAGAARRAISEGDYALVVVNTPLVEEFGHEIASHAAQSTSAGVILLAKEESFDALCHRVEADGVVVISKPLNRDLFSQAVRLLHITQQRMHALQQENIKLRRRLDEERMISRAKCILIECMAMTEPEAHAYLEKQAMNQRVTRHEVAMDVVQANG